jgi:hypothetical protein
MFMIELLVALETVGVNIISARWSGTTHPKLQHALAFGYLDRDNVCFHSIEDGDDHAVGDSSGRS